nr:MULTISPECIES: AAA domain-containing protein [unclassified Actinopolyspora]
MYKRALLIGTESYEDTELIDLRCTRADTAQLRQVLAHPAIGAFHDVDTATDPTAAEMSRRISDFLGKLGSEDLALLYISGHGTRTPSDGEFFFLASDTDSSRVEDTGVGASFVNECLELCAAPQKVAMLDCCYSGGYSMGMRTRAAKSTGRSSKLLKSRGVYVVSSSGPDEVSWGEAESSSDPSPSAFTGEVVDALRTGRGDTDNDGVVSVDELFQHVNDRLRLREFASEQIPTISSDKVNTRIELASAYAGPPLEEARTPSAEEMKSGERSVETSSSSSTSWSVLLDYYSRCLRGGGAEMPLMNVDQSDERYVCLTGTERLLSGDLDESGALAVPDEAAPFVEQTVQEGAEFWYGYPAVVLRHGPDGAEYRSPRFAPLFIRRVQLVSNDEGDGRLEPQGEVRPHPELARQVVGDEAAAELQKTFYSHWRGGMHSQLAQEISYYLREEFQLREVEPLRPSELKSSIDTGTPAEGARNAAVLFSVPPANRANNGLLQDLDKISAEETERIKSTALRPLLTGEADRLEKAGQWKRVTPLPLSERQEEVLSSAMERTLTVATGPPGTGKSQLVANLVATAVTNRQSVLVSSTNNRAVDEVWQRCERLVPGSLIRTGSAYGKHDYREAEREGLQKLLTGNRPNSNRTTALAKLEQANTALDNTMKDIAAKSEHEKELLSLSKQRAEIAEEIGGTTSSLSRDLGESADLDALARRAKRVAKARWFGRRRRARFLRKKLGWEAEASRELCESIGLLAAVEKQWRTKAARAEDLPGDDAQQVELDRANAEVRERSQRMLEQGIAESSDEGRQAILALTQSKQGGDWSELRAALRHVRGWAVTNHSVRRFPYSPGLFDLVIVDESSQCSIPQVLPALYRAKRALIIGDPMQLAPVVTLTQSGEDEARRETGVDGGWLEEQRRTYHRHSAFHAFRKISGGSLLLDEHFRCHPRIAAVSNENFYGRQLTVLTDVRKQRRLDRAPVMWSHVSGRAQQQRDGSWTNREEVSRVQDSVRYLLEQLPADGDVGVVTPFTAQAKLLHQWCEDDERVQIGTVHQFQGSERDAIVFSLVAGPGMRPGTLRWLNSQRNLWNVAISRARSHLIVVGDRDEWRAQGGIGGRIAEIAEGADERSDEVDPTDDQLLMRLYTLLDSAGSVECSLAEKVRGHHTDVLVRDGSGTTAVLLDRGYDGMPPGRHMRLQYERRRLLNEPGGEQTALRIPGWRVFDQEVFDSANGLHRLAPDS